MIINTHTHFDHVGGNVEFPATVEVVAQEQTAALMKEMRPVTGIPTPMPKIFSDSGGRGLPRRTFADRLTLGRDWRIPERFAKDGYASTEHLRSIRSDVEVIWNETK